MLSAFQALISAVNICFTITGHIWSTFTLQNTSLTNIYLASEMRQAFSGHLRKLFSSLWISLSKDLIFSSMLLLSWHPWYPISMMDNRSHLDVWGETWSCLKLMSCIVQVHWKHIPFWMKMEEEWMEKV